MIMETKEHEKARARNWKMIVMLLAGAFVIVGGVTVAIIYGYAARYTNTIAPGVSVGAYTLGGKTKEEAQHLLIDVLRPYNEQGIVVTFGDRAIAFPPVNVAPFDPDISQEVFHFNVEDSIEYAWRIGRRGDSIARFGEKAQVLLFGKKIPLNYIIHENVIVNVLKENFGDLEHPARNASLAFANDRARVDIVPEENGWIFDKELFLQDFKYAIASTSFGPVQLKQKNESSHVNAEQIRALLPAVERVMELESLTLIFEKKSWLIPQKVFRQWLDFVPDTSENVGALSTDTSENVQEKAMLVINRDAFREYASQTLEKAIRVFPQEPKFEIDPVTMALKRMNQGIHGREIDSDATALEIEKSMFEQNSTHVVIKIKEVLPHTSDISLSDLGIQEIIGTGYSNMKGSPKNRRHNIAIGAQALHGILIPAGEEFSLLRALGDINAKSGYLPELVIKGNKTIPEYGGGLCQIGTTTFRATLKSGLPILERQNHSYQVPYYTDEKGRPGTDATIYDPAPDYRFLNDTGDYVLIQTRIIGDDIYFDFWGTKDGRKVYQSETKVWGVTKPPPTKIIETTDLAPGEKKCTERPHNGANAEFTYDITYSSGEKKTRVFTSQYRPWQEVCLVGVETTENIPPEDTTPPQEIQQPSSLDVVPLNIQPTQL